MKLFNKPSKRISKKRLKMLLEKYNNGEVLHINDGIENIKCPTDPDFPGK